MNIVVLGAGAIGSFYGAKLSVSHDVLLVARKAHVDQVEQRGVRLTGLESATGHVKAATHIQIIACDTLILLTTKAQDTETAVKGVLDQLHPDTVLLCLQNGLYTEAAAKKIVGTRCVVLRAITYFGTIFEAPGVIALKASGTTYIEDSPKTQQIAKTFSERGLNGGVSSNIKEEMWTKVVFNCVVNPLTVRLA